MYGDYGLRGLFRAMAWFVLMFFVMAGVLIGAYCGAHWTTLCKVLGVCAALSAAAAFRIS